MNAVQIGEIYSQTGSKRPKYGFLEQIYSFFWTFSTFCSNLAEMKQKIKNLAPRTHNKYFEPFRIFF
jgi:hypothetical protein